MSLIGRRGALALASFLVLSTMAPAQERAVEGADGVSIAFRVSGAGRPVLLLHGWPERGSHWSKVVAVLQADHRLIVPDLRGFGASGRPREAAYDGTSVASDFARVIEAAALGPVHVIAHDVAGPPAYLLAAQRPDLVRSLTLVETTLPNLSPAEVPQLGGIWHPAFHATPDLPETLIRGREDAYFGWFFRAYAAGPQAVPASHIADVVAAMREPGALEAGLAHYRAFKATAEQVTAASDRGPLRVPMLGIGGTVLGSLPERSLRKVGQTVTGRVIEGCGHWMLVECPERLAVELRAFLTEQDR